MHVDPSRQELAFRACAELVVADAADERDRVAELGGVIRDVGGGASEPRAIGKQIPEQLTPADQQREFSRALAGL